MFSIPSRGILCRALLITSVLLVRTQSASAAGITLAGFELYTSTSMGSYNPPYGGYRYSSNSHDVTSDADAITSAAGGPSQSRAINFPLVVGLNTFSFQTDPSQGNGNNVDPQAFAGVNLFFSGDGSSFNPTTMGIPSHLTGFVATTGGSLQIPTAGVLVQDYGPIGPALSFTAEPYSGANSFTIGNEIVAITALSINHTPSGSIILRVSSVPEPTIIAFMMLGVAGLLARRRR